MSVLKWLVLVLLGVVVLAAFYFTYLMHTDSLTAWDESCGTIYEGVGYRSSKASSEADKVKAVACLVSRFKNCELASFAVRAAGYEGETYEFDYQIKSEDVGCVIERYNWGKAVNTCHGLESVDFSDDQRRAHHLVMTDCESEGSFTDVLQSYKVESL